METGRNGVIGKVRAVIYSHSMIQHGENVICALSGGADSVCLLLALKDISREMDFSLSAFHVNHSMRGDESDGDELFCKRLCERLDIPFSSARVDVYARAAETGESSEEAARVLRYAALDNYAESINGAKIATAHNLCDNSETMLFNLTRGTGLKGLCGIPYVRGNIIRPLIEVTRDEIEAFLKEKGQDFVTDSTNLTDDYSRNMIRHNVIPRLMKINPSLHEALLRLRESAAQDDALLTSMADAADKSIGTMPSPVRKRYIRSRLEEAEMSVSADRLALLDSLMETSAGCSDTKRYQLSGSIFAVFRKGVMTVEDTAPVSTESFRAEIRTDISSEVNIPQYDKTVKITRYSGDISDPNSIVNEKLTNHCLNCVKIQGVAILRNKQDGDRFEPSGKPYTVRLKKLFSSMKIPVSQRQTALVIEDDKGIIWSEYGGVSKRAACSPKDISDGCGFIAVEVVRGCITPQEVSRR